MHVRTRDEAKDLVKFYATIPRCMKHYGGVLKNFEILTGAAADQWPKEGRNVYTQADGYMDSTIHPAWMNHHSFTPMNSIAQFKRYVRQITTP